MILFCPRHRIGFNDDLDATCPQCTLAGISAPDPYQVDAATLDVAIPATATDKRPVNLRTRK